MPVRKLLHDLVALLSICGILALTSAPATALQTPVFPGGGGSEPDLMDVLDNLYGLGNLQRVDDLDDQVWWNINGGALAKAKYAGYALDFGYIDSNGFNFLFSTPPNWQGELIGYEGETPDHLELPSFRWGIYTSAGDTWSSLMSENSDSYDHMVTWKVIGEDNTFVVAWEDLYSLGDGDYQDLIVEVNNCACAIPDASALVLLGSAMIGVGVFGRKKVFKKKV